MTVYQLGYFWPLCVCLQLHRWQLTVTAAGLSIKSTVNVINLRLNTSNLQLLLVNYKVLPDVFLAPASEMKRFVAFLCFTLSSIEYLWGLVCCLDETRNLKTSPWVLGACDHGRINRLHTKKHIFVQIFATYKHNEEFKLLKQHFDTLRLKLKSGW